MLLKLPLTLYAATMSAKNAYLARDAATPASAAAICRKRLFWVRGKGEGEGRYLLLVQDLFGPGQTLQRAAKLNGCVVVWALWRSSSC